MMMRARKLVILSGAKDLTSVARCLLPNDLEGENVQRSTFNVQRLNSELRFAAAASSRAFSIEALNVERWTLNVFFPPCEVILHARYR